MAEPLTPSAPAALPVQCHSADHRLPDGTLLAGRLWRPQGEGSWPTLLVRQPYGLAIAATVTYAHPRWYAGHGFAVLVQDVRGRGDSGGTFGGFDQEAVDGSSTLAWLRQQPWCNGRVGTYGHSYQGLTQLLYEPQGPLPDALAPAMAGLDEQQHWSQEGGAGWWALGLGWGLQLAAQGCRRRGDGEGWRQIRRSLEGGSFLEEGLELLERHDPDGMGLRWLKARGDDPGVWRRHQPPEALWSRPMLLIGGWFDPHLGGILDLWQQASQRGQEPLLRIGAWSHLNWQGGLDRLQLAFFQRHLGASGSADSSPRNNPRPAQAPASQPSSLMADLAGQRWLARSPRQSSGQSWTLASQGLAAIDPEEGRLLPGPAAGGGVVELVHDPWRPAPARGGHLGLDAGPVDRIDLDARPDVACFTTAPLAAAMELLGQPVLELAAQADQPGFDLCVALAVLRGDGRVEQISTGVRRWLGATASEPMLRRVALQPLLISLAKGERLRLSVALAAWPQVAVNPGTGEHPCSALTAEHRQVSVVLHLAQAQLCIVAMVGANWADST